MIYEDVYMLGYLVPLSSSLVHLVAPAGIKTLLSLLELPADVAPMCRMTRGRVHAYTR